jgi:hypothetical protein
MTARRPSGPPAPTVARVDGVVTALAPLAEAITTRYLAEYPEEAVRHGEATSKWCQHDNQWLLSWAVDDVRGATDLEEQAQWLARVLHVRGIPVSRLARDLDIASEVVRPGAFGAASEPIAERLQAAARTVAALTLSESTAQRTP